MKATDIRRLLKVVELYEEIERLLGITQKSVHDSPPEYYPTTEHRTDRLIEAMRKDANFTKEWIKHKIQIFEEL